MAIWHLLLYLSHARVSTRRKFKHKPWTWICWKTTYLLGGLVTLQGLWLLNFGCVGPLDTCYVWPNLEGHPICLVWVPRCHICMKSKSNLAVEPTPWKKYWSTWESSPNSSENKQHIWKHHLVLVSLRRHSFKTTTKKQDPASTPVNLQIGGLIQGRQNFKAQKKVAPQKPPPTHPTKKTDPFSPVQLHPCHTLETTSGKLHAVPPHLKKNVNGLGSNIIGLVFPRCFASICKNWEGHDGCRLQSKTWVPGTVDLPPWRQGKKNHAEFSH